MELFTHYMAKAKSAVRRPRAGRPSHEELGLAPKRKYTAMVETGLLDAALARFGSMNQIVKYAMAQAEAEAEAHLAK